MSVTFIINVLVFAAIDLISVLGVFALIGLTGLFSFGQVGFMAIGAYISALSVTRYNLPFFVGVLMAVALSVLVGLLIGFLTLKLRTDYFALATFGFAEIVKAMLNHFDSFTGGAMGLYGIPVLTSAPLVFGVAVGAVILMRNFKNSKFGRDCIAIRTDELAASVMGIDVFWRKMTVFLLSAVLGAVSGALYAFYVTYIEPDMFNWGRSVELIIVVFFGGLNSLTGCVVSSLILSILPEVLRFASEWRTVLYILIVIVTILFRPSGLFGSWELSLQQIKFFRRGENFARSDQHK